MNNKQIHVDLPRELYDSFLEILPERRMVSFMVRVLIKNFVEKSKTNEVNWQQFFTAEGDKDDN